MKSVECQTEDHLMQNYLAEKEKQLQGENDDPNFLDSAANSRIRKNARFNGAREPTAGMKKLQQIQANYNKNSSGAELTKNSASILNDLTNSKGSLAGNPQIQDFNLPFEGPNTNYGWTKRQLCL